MQHTPKKRNSSIWSHFTVDNRADKAICNVCKSTFAYYKGTTSNLWKHLLKVHSIEKSEKNGNGLRASQLKATINSSSNTTERSVVKSVRQTEHLHSLLTQLGKEIVDGQSQLKLTKTIAPQCTQLISVVAAAAESDYILPDSIPIAGELGAETANIASAHNQVHVKIEENDTITYNQENNEEHIKDQENSTINNDSHTENEVGVATQQIPVVGCKRKRIYTISDRAQELHEYERRRTEAQESMAASLALVAKSITEASKSFIDHINTLKNK